MRVLRILWLFLCQQMAGEFRQMKDMVKGSRGAGGHHQEGGGDGVWGDWIREVINVLDRRNVSMTP